MLLFLLEIIVGHLKFWIAVARQVRVNNSGFEWNVCPGEKLWRHSGKKVHIENKHAICL